MMLNTKISKDKDRGCKDVNRLEDIEFPVYVNFFSVEHELSMTIFTY